jgi:hypothetical protein
MVDFVGISSVADRTLFTNRGPIVKRPLPVLVGSDLRVSSYSAVSIASGNFSQSDVGKLLEVSGSPNGRNDGRFRISDVLSATSLRLEGASFSVLDEEATVESCVALANDLKAQLNLHRTRLVTVGGELVGSHGTPDMVNVVTAGDAVDLASAVALANDILVRFNAHAVLASGNPRVHIEPDVDNVVAVGPAASLSDLINLLNELRRRYELHRQDHFVHQNVDLVDRVQADHVQATVNVYPGPLTGPFSWTLLEPRYGEPADSPYDVRVTVNGSPAGVDAVFGMLGAVVLSEKPSWDDEVSIDYDHISNPPSRFMRLNSPEFVLNQCGSTAISGFPKHRYGSSSHLMTDSDGPGLAAPFQPLRRGWKYKAVERAYTAVLNDPSSLLLNVPTNKISYPVLTERVPEVTVRYDPATLPQNAVDPWTFVGQGSLSLAPGGSSLTVVDSSTQTGVDSLPPFFTHALSLDTESSVSAAFRARMSADPAVFSPDGVFGGVCFGVSDGRKSAIVGFILTEATNLTSAVVMANDAKAQLNGHLRNVGSHFPDDLSDEVSVVDATGLPSLLVLANSLRSAYSSHAGKGSGVGHVHLVPDSVNVISLPEAEDLASAILLVNEIRSRLNAHGVQPGVHFSSDPHHQVSLVRQAGILTNRGFPEVSSSWNSFASDWTQYRTYRVARDPDGSVGVYVNGGVSPAAEAPVSELPAPSDIDARFDVIQQTFFGTIGRDSKSSSDWQFVRVNVQPVDADLIENNKQVDYGASAVPELDPDAPWITYGQGGVERVLSPDVLLLDSTDSAALRDVPELGLVSGAYRGFVRYEPILSTENALVAEFRMGADYWTQSVNDRAFGLFMSDGTFSVQLSFLQASPTPAVAVGTVAEPFALVNGDTLVVQVGREPAETISFLIPPGTNTAASVAARVNSALGFPFASASSGRVRLTSAELGASASFSILSGSSLAKLGLSPGTYFGSDSSPEPCISWFGANLPELDDPTWSRSGGQAASLYNRVLRVEDTSASDYVTWVLEDPLVTNRVLNPQTDWKVDVRLSVLSFVPGPTVPASGPYVPLDFAGALVSVDEGPAGKNVEFHFSVDPSGSQFLNLLSYDQSSGSLEVMAQYAFAWSDGRAHTVNLYTSKASNTLMVLGDGVLLSPYAGPSPTYSGLRSGVSGPSISFGSGGEPVVGSDLRVAKSVVDWESVAAFRDQKVGDPSSAGRRYVGVYKGGPVDVLSSYYLHQVDWAPLHTYRVLRDPSSGLQIYLDGSPTPSISVPYDVLTLPPSRSSFLHEASRGRPFIAFGAFSPSSMSRTRWDFVRYSVGKITLTDLLVPPHQVLNQVNVVSSPDHLRTKVPHGHQGFAVYSGGTPTDEFMADESVTPFTVLGDGTPPVPATQNLETRRGMVKVGTPVDGIPALDVVGFSGFTSDLVDDVVNVAGPPPVTVSSVTAAVIALSNSFRSAYEAHRLYPGVHAVNDTFNPVSASPASDLATAITLLNNEKERFNLHLVQPGVHVPSDLEDTVSAPDAHDLSSAAVLSAALKDAYSAHAGTGAFHLVPDVVDTVSAPEASDLLTAAVLASTVADSLQAHALSTAFHETPDFPDGRFSPPVLPGVGKSGVNGLSVLVTSESLDPGQIVLFVDGPNSGQSRFVVSKLSSSQYSVAPGFLFNDPGQSRYVRLGRSSVTDGRAEAGPGYSTVYVTGDPLSVSVGDSVMFLEGPNVGEPRTVTLAGSPFRVSPPLPVSDPVPSSWRMSRVSQPSLPGVDPAYVVSLSNSLKRRLNSHYVSSGVHRTDDVLDRIVFPDAATLQDSISLLNAVKASLNPHLTGSRFHLVEDTFNVVSAPSPVEPVGAAVSALNSARSSYLSHLSQARVHLQDDDSNTLLPLPAYDLGTAISLANALKLRINRHLTALVHEVVGSPVQRVHSEDDTVNAITEPDSHDLASLCALSIDIVDRYNAHRTQPGVHGSTLMIRLEAPSRVLYEGLRFWSTEEGDRLASVYPFSDGDAPSVTGPVRYAGTTSYSYRGDILPEEVVLFQVMAVANGLKAAYNSHRAYPGVHPSPDGVNVVSAPNATGLASAIALLTDLKARFTDHLSQPGVHLSADTVDRIVASDPNALAMAVSLAEELLRKYSSHILSEAYHLIPDDLNAFRSEPLPPPGDPGWVLRASNESAVSVSLVSFPENAVRVETLPPGTTAVYRMRTGIPDSRSIGMEFEVRLRIESFQYDPNVETGIYVGFLSNAGPGVAAAVGFDALNNIPYVKIQDVNSGKAVVRIPFNWGDGQFHTYKIVRDPLTDSLNLSVID